MGFNNNTPRQEFVASAAQVDFIFNFKIYSDSDIVAYLTPAGQAADDTADLLTLTTDYTIVIDGDNGGTLTLTSGATNGDKVTITRELPYTRTIDYAYGGDLKESTLDLDQDYQTYLAQQLESSKVRFLNIPNSVQGVDASLPAPVGDAYFKWSADALSIENDTTIPDAVTTSAASATQAQLYEWEAEAERLTADSYATEAEDVPVNLVTSDGDGTFTYTPQVGIYSALHWAAKAATFNPADFVVIENNETIVHDITVDADYTLTALQNKYGRIEITDTGVLLTTGRNIVVDNIQGRFIFVNSSAQTLTPKTAAGTGIAVAAGETVDLYNDGTNVIRAVDVATFTGGLSTDNFIHVQDQKPSGTSGGAAVAGYQTRTLNTVLTNTITGASLASSIVTLPAGDYYAEGNSIGRNIDGFQASLYNNDTSSFVLYGTSEHSLTADAQARSFFSGVFTLGVETDVLLRFYATNANAISGLGIAVASGEIEVFSDLKIWKVG